MSNSCSGAQTEQQVQACIALLLIGASTCHRGLICICFHILKPKVVFSCNTYGIPAEGRVRIATLRLEGDAAKFQAELTTAGEMPSTLEELYAKLKARYPVSPEETAPYLLVHQVVVRRYGAVSSGETG